VSGLAFPVPDEWLEAIAERVVELLAERPEISRRGELSPYFNIAEAADYLRTNRQRIYDLLSDGRLTRLKDGSRVLVSRAELEGHLVDTGAATPAAMPRAASQ
jgi:excisionase family DNA binding protein